MAISHTKIVKYVVSFIGNFIWKLFGGVWLATVWFLLGIILTFTIVGYPLAVGCFKIGWLCFKPTNKRASVYFERHLPLNILWILLVGWVVLPYAVISVTLNLLSIFGIPLTVQWIKVGLVCLFPFGAIIE